MSADLPPNVVRIHDYHLKRERKSLERQAAKIMSLIEFAREGGPVVEGAVPCADPWAGRHLPGGVDDLPWPS